ncbi:hypothetical protein QLL91_001732 [Yersinia enterocolitica]|nr:hypothetical protein [Yersinia enterocolitica]
MAHSSYYQSSFFGSAPTGEGVNHAIIPPVRFPCRTGDNQWPLPAAAALVPAQHVMPD